MREAMPAHIKPAGVLAEELHGNEEETTQNRVGSLFTNPCHDLTEPRKCIPDSRGDIRPNRPVKPIDSAFLLNDHPIVFVEPKEVRKELADFDESLADTSASPPRPG
jgi:hypothetical protein